MIFKHHAIRIVVHLWLLVVAIGVGVYLLLKHWFVYEWLVVPVLLYQIWYFYYWQMTVARELKQFTEAVKYRDFSGQYNEHSGTAAVRLLHQSFNEVNASFRALSKEKEVQYQYLQNVLELIDTGILAYEVDKGEVTWMNTSLKNLLKLPYLKNINGLLKRDQPLAELILALRPGEQTVYTLDTGKGEYKLLVSATNFSTGNLSYKLVAFQNANEVLDAAEANAWQKLLRVMTHEIMNSVAPIHSLADTLSARLGALGNEIADVDDIQACIETIKTRSQGLLKFTDTYRHLNRATVPDRKEVQMSTLLGTIYRLMAPTIEQKGIDFEIEIADPGMVIWIDAPLIEQVLINLLLNAIEAVRDAELPQITLSALWTPDGKAQIKVRDNGTGIDKELADKIFIPFFSTRKNGSGIGLSLCRQIMTQHKGSIQVVSTPGEGTEFLLVF